LRRQALKLLRLGFVLVLCLGIVVLAWRAPAAWAAEVLQVRSGVLLQVGDQNRSYPVQLGCISVEPGASAAAAAWLRAELPRSTRVNLRPLGTADGVLLSQVRRLPGGVDLGSALVEAGLASRLPEAIAPAGCPPAALPP
jgi:endonuclease YncB( thermonuclease family)